MANGRPAVDHVTDLEDQRRERWDRRKFVKGVSALAGSGGLLGYDLSPAAAEPPPETTKIRVIKIPAICLVPEYLAEELLRVEGFTDIQYVQMDQARGAGTKAGPLEAKQADISVETPPSLLPALDIGKPIVALAPLHGGCYELFGNERVRTIRDLRGKRVAISAIGSVEYYYVASMVAYVGMNPNNDIKWVEGQTFDETMRVFIEGKADAILGFPPQPQELRAKKIGTVIVNTAQDRPWQQYDCCMMSAHREFVHNYPVATKRAVRAILKAADICTREPELAARYIVDKGFERRYEIALEVLKSLSYDRWRTHNPEDSLRFYGLRLYEGGLIKTNPQKLIAQGTDWRFLNELKKELKA